MGQSHFGPAPSGTGGPQAVLASLEPEVEVLLEPESPEEVLSELEELDDDDELEELEDDEPRLSVL